MVKSRGLIEVENSFKNVKILEKIKELIQK